MPDKQNVTEHQKPNGKNFEVPSNLESFYVEPEVLKLIPKKVASKYVLLPLLVDHEVLHVAMENPEDPSLIDQVRRLTNLRAVFPHAAKKESVLAAIDRNYALMERVQDILREVQKERFEEGETGEEGQSESEAASQAPMVKLVDYVIQRAVQERASDIHFEPEENLLRVRFRIDGQLHESYVFKKDLQSAVLTRLKIIAGLDIGEKRRPQDGRFLFRLESKQIDVRVSSLPSIHGENIVLRLLDKTSVSRDLSHLGMSGNILPAFREIIQHPHGIVLVTGPTGSGKSTTLYAALGEITTMEKNIVTVEDPVEYHMDLVRQTQVNPKIGLTFANGLRSILRQDPDIIFIGEIRDTETAEIAVQAALTGHLVLSTLHTNDACGAITRLEDMGIPPYLIASSVIGIMAQRLVRKICVKCKAEVKVPESVLKELGIEKKPVFYQGKGCDVCKQQGYHGRTSIHEYFRMSNAMRESVVKRADWETLYRIARQEGMQSLRESGIQKAQEGITTLEEVLSVTQEV